MALPIYGLCMQAWAGLMVSPCAVFIVSRKNICKRLVLWNSFLLMHKLRRRMQQESVITNFIQEPLTITSGKKSLKKNYGYIHRLHNCVKSRLTIFFFL